MPYSYNLLYDLLVVHNFSLRFQVRPSQRPTDYWRAKGDQIPAPPLDLVHRGLPHLVVRSRLRHVHLRHNSWICGWTGSRTDL